MTDDVFFDIDEGQRQRELARRYPEIGKRLLESARRAELLARPDLDVPIELQKEAWARVADCIHELEAADIERKNRPLTFVGPSFPLIDVADIPEIVSQTWLIEGLIPIFEEGSAGYYFAPAKGRKSMFLADLAISVATGTPALGIFPVKKTGTVVGFYAEDPKGETSRRMHRLCRSRGLAFPKGKILLFDVPSISLDDIVHQEKILNTLKAIPDLAFVFFDPMVRMHSINDNRAEELAPIHTFLRVLSRSLAGVALMLAHHANKGDGGARGSSEFNAFGDFNLYGKTTDDFTTEVYRVENRGGPPGKPFSYQVVDEEVNGEPAMRLVAKVEEHEQPQQKLVDPKRLVQEAILALAMAREIQPSGSDFLVRPGQIVKWVQERNPTRGFNSRAVGVILKGFGFAQEDRDGRSVMYTLPSATLKTWAEDPALLRQAPSV